MAAAMAERQGARGAGGSADRDEVTMEKEGESDTELASQADELRWPSPPARRPVLDLPKTPPRAPQMARDSSTYFEALKGRAASNELTNSPSDGADVRWFFSKKALGVDQAAALVPATEAALKGEWLRFGTLDSAALEAAYRQQEEMLLSCWWREFAEVSIGPQLKDRERLERGAAATAQSSPQASPLKSVPSKSAKAAQSPAPAVKKLQEEPAGASPLKERPSNKAAPAAEERSTNDKKEPQSPVKSQTDAEQVEESFFSKVSSYLPSFRSQSGPSAQSPSKPQPPDMSATGEGEKAGDTKAKVSKDPAEGSRSESGTAGSEDSTDKVDPGTKGEGDSATEASSSQSLVGESGAASVKTARKEAEALAEIPAAGGPNATADTAPLTEVSEAAKVDPESSQADSAPEPPKSTVSESDDSSEIGIQVKGGLYECFLEKRKLSAIFWKAGHRRILRGSWFAQPRKTKDWLPLREDIAEQLEIAYRGQVWRRRSFLPNGMYAHRVNIAGPSLGLYALFTGEDDTWEAWLGVDGSGVISRMFSAGHPTTRLRRGFREEGAPVGQEEIKQRRDEMDDDRKAQVPVRHLVFMVHGIGQRLERANIVDDVHKFQAVSDAMLDQFLTPHQRQAQRVLFIPCQWRKILQLGGEMIIDDITMEGIRGIRQIVNATVLDVLYYMSPVYCQDIVNSVCRALNRQYARFRRRNPSFDGQVHIFGHSLGSVLTYDILCHQPKPFLADLHARLLASAAPAKPASTAGGALGCIAEDSAGDPSPASDDDVSVQRADVSETGRESIESAVPAKPGADVSGQRADVSGTGREVGGAGADVSRGADVDERGGNVKRASEEGSGDGARGKSSEEVTESDGKGVQIGGDWELEEGVRLEKEGDAKAEEDFGSRNQGQTPESISKPQATKDEAEEGVTGSQKDKETDRKETGEAGEGEGAGKGIDEGGGPGAREGGGEEHRETGPVGSMQVDRAKENTRTGECEDLASNVERGDSGEGVEKAETVSGVPAQSDGPIGDSTSEVAGAERSEQKEQTETSEEGEVLGWKTTSPDGQGAGQAVVEKQPTPGASEQSAVRAEAAGKPEGGAGDSSSGPPRNGSGDAELAALRAEVALLREKLRRLEGLPGNEDGENLEISNGGLAGGAKRALSFAERLTAVVGNKTETQSPTLEGETGTGDDRLSSMQATAGQAHGDVSAPSGDVTEGSKEEAGLDLRTLEGPSSAEARALQPTSVDTERTASVNTAPSSSVNIPQPLAEIKEAFRSATAKTTFAASRPPLISTPSVDVRLDDVKSTLDAEILRKRGPHAFVHYPRLAFEVDTFFAVGSPLGMFLALRNIEFGSATRGENMDLKKLEESMPAARHMVNIFHPYDPVAYRIEPLVSKDFVARRPVFIPYHRGGQRLHIGMQQLRDDLSARSRALQNDIISSLSSMKTKIASTFGGADQGSAAEAEGGGDEVNPHTALVMERVTGSKHGRIDFMLQDATFEHPYISALSSHTAYWKDEDTALFVTRHLYRDVPEAPPGAENHSGEANPGQTGEVNPDTAVKPDRVKEEAVGKLKGEKAVPGEGPGEGTGDRKGLRSRQGSTGNLTGLKRSLSVGDQLAKEDDIGGSSLGSLFWGGGGLKSGPEGPPTEFDTWIADDETGLFYMPGVSTPSKSQVPGFRQEDTSESESEEAIRGVRQLAERER